MDIETFVRETLVQIVRGTANARTELEADGVLINPAGVSFDPSGDFGYFSGNTTYQPRTQVIRFDVSVGVERTEGKEGGGKLRVPFLEAGAGAEAQTKESATSRIRFAIPIYAPAPRDQEPR